MMLEFALPAALIIALDQATKNAVAARLGQGECQMVGSLAIRYLRHRPGLQKLGLAPLIVLWAGLVVTAVLLGRAGYFFHNPAARISLGAALGGAGSNLYDRLRLGGVVDFLDVGWWPVFNLADVAITLGAIFALWFGTRP
jgi:signal peptidase II